MMGMSPRLASIDSRDPIAPHNLNSNDEHMNSSCKDTMKMNREFSFFESVNREFGNANAGGGIYHGSLGQSKHINQFESINIGQPNDTVSRLHGLNTSEMKREAGILYGADGAPCNPFISDSVLFQNSGTNESNQFGINT